MTNELTCINSLKNRIILAEVTIDKQKFSSSTNYSIIRKILFKPSWLSHKSLNEERTRAGHMEMKLRKQIIEELEEYSSNYMAIDSDLQSSEKDMTVGEIIKILKNECGIKNITTNTSEVYFKQQPSSTRRIKCSVTTYTIPENTPQKILWNKQRTGEEYLIGYKIQYIIKMLEFLSTRKNENGKTMNQLVDEEILKLKELIAQGKLNNENGWQTQRNDYDWLIGRRGRKDKD